MLYENLLINRMTSYGSDAPYGLSTFTTHVPAIAPVNA